MLFLADIARLSNISSLQSPLR